MRVLAADVDGAASLLPELLVVADGLLCVVLELLEVEVDGRSGAEVSSDCCDSFRLKKLPIEKLETAPVK